MLLTGDNLSNVRQLHLYAVLVLVRVNAHQFKLTWKKGKLLERILILLPPPTCIEQLLVDLPVARQ